MKSGFDRLQTDFAWSHHILFFIGFRLSEGEAALAGTAFLKPHTCEEIASDFAEAGPYALALLANICR